MTPNVCARWFAIAACVGTPSTRLGPGRSSTRPVSSSLHPGNRLVEGGLVPSSFGFLGTYPPTQCGLATFSRDLMRSIAPPASGDRAGIVRVVDVPTGSVAPEVVGHLHALSPGSHVAAADALNTFDVAVVQYDRDIYGGQD